MITSWLRIVVLLLCSASSSFAHDWYPRDCCSGQDCKPIADTRVIRLPDGAYLIDAAHRFEWPRQVGVSQSGRYHICDPTPETTDDRPRCFFAPSDGT